MMKNFPLIIIVSILLIIASCNNNTDKRSKHYKIDLDKLDQQMDALLLKLPKEISLDTLFDDGFHEIAFKIIDNSNTKATENQKLYYAKLFISHGIFEKGLNYLEEVTSPQFKYEVIDLKLSAALSKEDTLLTQFYLDTLETLSKIDNNPVRQFDFMIQKGYAFHNKKDYQQALMYYYKADKLLPANNFNPILSARLYRRLGNTYNDICRYHLIKLSNYNDAFELSLQYYQKELKIINNLSTNKQSKIAINSITKAMLLRTRPEYNVKNLYFSALKNLIVENKPDYLITRNNVSTSMVLTQLSELYLSETSIESKKMLDSLMDMNQLLLNQEAISSLTAKEGIDIKRYYHQRSQKVKILKRIFDNSLNLNALELLNISNKAKYPQFYLIPNMQKSFGDDYQKAAKLWILLKEIKYLGYHYNRSDLIAFANKNLADFIPLMDDAINYFENHKIGESELIQLETYCNRKNTTIVDYQMLYEQAILITRIDGKGIKQSIIKFENIVNLEDINKLLSLAKVNNYADYENLAFNLTRKLELDSIKSKNIMICPDEILEKLPFDALVKHLKKAKKWQDMSFLIDYHSISYIPNILMLLDGRQLECDNKIDLWYSDEDNKTLPYNQNLIRTLVNEYAAVKNTSSINSKGIVHIIAHSYHTINNELQLKLNSDTINVYTKNLAPVLAVLQSCSSGDGKSIQSEGMLSIPRMFIYNGTQAVISSFWNTDNASSVEIYTKFYAAFFQGNNSANALYIAKKNAKGNIMHPEWSNPLYWANYRILGNPISIRK